MQTWLCKNDLGWGSARGVFCDFDRFSSFNFRLSRILTDFPFCRWFFLGLWQVFLLVRDLSMRHRHADKDMQIWLGACRAVPEGLSVILMRFPLSILHGFPFCKWFSLDFGRFSYWYSDISMRHGDADMDMQIWLGTCRGVQERFSVILRGFPLSILHLRGFWQVFLFVGDFCHDFDRFSVSDISMRHRHADMDMQIWLGTCGSARGGVCDVDTFCCFNFALSGILSIMHFLGFWQVFLLVSDFDRFSYW